MKYLRHKVNSNDGKSYSIYLMREDVKSFGRCYFWFAEKQFGAMGDLSIHPSIRKQGEGTRLQKIREGIIKRKGYKYSIFWVTKGSWMEVWYKRRGYKFYRKNKNEKGCVWLRKKL